GVVYKRHKIRREEIPAEFGQAPSPDATAGDGPDRRHGGKGYRRKPSGDKQRSRDNKKRDDSKTAQTPEAAESGPSASETPSDGQKPSKRRKKRWYPRKKQTKGSAE
ncbi:MAG: hypothetical protein K2J38_01305, partial [Muribaculaceae bacterium]|nr:hypothetical protein [Muribaculaceae bacterium]